MLGVGTLGDKDAGLGSSGIGSKRIIPDRAGSVGSNIDRHRLEDYDEAMRRIKDATGVSDVNEIIQKFATQNDTYSNLQELKSVNERKLLEL
jgi:hypothetical protein